MRNNKKNYNFFSFYSYTMVVFLESNRPARVKKNKSTQSIF